jgi:predicted nucleic acid-binding protein
LTRPAYLFDTNAISETRRKIPDAVFTSFLSRVGESPIYISVLTLGELRKGIAKKRRTDTLAADALAAWVHGIELRFAGDILPVTQDIANIWGDLSADRPRAAVDTLLAATAISHDLTVVTRNTVDFVDLPVKIVTPWEG